jgi:hypothetical protein
MKPEVLAAPRPAAASGVPIWARMQFVIVALSFASLCFAQRDSGIRDGPRAPAAHCLDLLRTNWRSSWRVSYIDSAAAAAGPATVKVLTTK